jgi:hypothetical protein
MNKSYATPRAQVLLHAANHKLAFLVLYCGASADVLDIA